MNTTTLFTVNQTLRRVSGFDGCSRELNGIVGDRESGLQGGQRVGPSRQPLYKCSDVEVAVRITDERDGCTRHS